MQSPRISQTELGVVNFLCAVVGLSCLWLQALCGFLYEDEQNIIKEFEDDWSSQLRKVCLVICISSCMTIIQSLHFQTDSHCTKTTSALESVND